MTSLAHALRYLTIAPIPAGAHVEPTTLGRAAAWFPSIGLALGLVVAGGERVISVVFPSLLDALLAVTLWKLLTGGLHLDGLGGLLVFVPAAGASLRLGRFYMRLLGGVTGDVLGAVVESAELIVLLTVVAWTSGPR